MPSGRITKATVDRLAAGEKDIFLWDEDLSGFGIRTTPKGAKTYVLQYRMGGREAPTRRYTIGRHGSPWTPTTARKEAERLLILIHQGIDPVQADYERRRQAIDLAFDSYAETFINLYLKKRWKQWSLGAGVLRREVVPVLHNKPLPAIKRSDLTPVWDAAQHRPAIARLTFATLRKLFRWAISRGDIERSPLDGVEPPPAVAARERVLSEQELAMVWAGCEQIGYPFGQLIKLLILTGQRRNEVASLDWNELDRDAALWILPASRSKNKKPHLIPLSSEAVVILDEISQSSEWPSRGLVFSTNGKGPVSGFSKAKSRLDDFVHRGLAGRSEQPWRIHDLRRTVATGLQRLGVRFEVTEAVLNHLSGSRAGVAGVYQRHDWRYEKGEALSRWARHLVEIAGSNGLPSRNSEQG